MAKDYQDREDLQLVARQLREKFNDVLSEPIPSDIELLLIALEEASKRESTPAE